MARKEVFLRSAFNYDMDAASNESAVIFDNVNDPSVTKQSFKDECDINEIVRRFGLTGELPSGVVAPTYGDFSDVYDFHSAMAALSQAREAFETLPADIRYRFHNDPGEFVDFCEVDANRAEAEKLGLVFPQRLPADGVSTSMAATEAAAGGVPTGPGE